MKHRIKTFSLGAAWEEAIAFVRAEYALLAPLALLGFALPMAIFELIQPDRLIVNNQIAAGPWMLWAIPDFLCSLLGTLSISALALNPGMSVREGLSLAFARLPASIAVALLGFGAFLLAMIGLLVIASLNMTAAGQPGPIAALAFLLFLSAFVFLAVRLLPVWAVLIYRPVTPLAAIRETFQLTRRRYARLLLLRIVALMTEIVVGFVVVMPIAVVFGLIGRLSGAASVSATLSLLASSAVAAAIMTIWTVYVARLTVRLSEPISGI